MNVFMIYFIYIFQKPLAISITFKIVYAKYYFHITYGKQRISDDAGRRNTTETDRKCSLLSGI
jgi:hypothetical protein